VVGLSIAIRCPDADVTLVELDPLLTTLAQRNAERNALSERARVVVADIAEGGRLLHGEARPEGLAPGGFDHLVSNPPYHAVGRGTPPAGRIRAAAHQMAEGSLDRWVAFLATAGTADATLTMIHRTEALPDILAALDGRFGAVRILPVQPRAEAPAGRIVVTAVKGSRAPLELRPALILHDADNRPTARLEAILRHGAALSPTP
jgi:tRNA1(Val) A37 N6-methylase TrmN6